MKKRKPYLIKELRDLGVAKIRFYRTGTYLVNNISTVCLFLNNIDMPLARGIAIRSILDPIDKRLGRAMSYGRAKKAFLEEKTTGEIRPNLIRTGPSVIIRRKKTFSSEEENKFRSEMKFYGWKFKEISSKNGKWKIFQYYIPRNFMVSLCFDTFKFKSDCEPTLTPLEYNFVNHTPKVKVYKKS